MLNYFFVFIGGGLGAVARFGIGSIVNKYNTSDFPLGTLASNVLSCIVMGLVLYMSTNLKCFSDELKLLLIIGFCGGFSTFSTFSIETLSLFRSGQTWLAIINIFLSVVVCMMVLYLFLQKQKV